MSTPTKVLVSGQTYNIFKHDGIRNELPVGVYEIGFSMQGPYLTKQDDIELPKKIYSNDTDFIAHVMKSWDNLEKGNLGVGLVGGKGLGKSLTCNLICQKTGLPVIKLSKMVGDTSFIDYIKQLDQDFVLFIDEFEKIFPKDFNGEDGRASQEQLLSFLDGGTVGSNKILFLITSNSESSISDFMKNRPSRLRYFKKYEVLEERIIREVVDDLLENREYLDDLLQNLPYQDINLDSLIKVIQEINLHDQPYSKFRVFFNFTPEVWLNYDIHLLHDDDTLEPLRTGFTHPLYYSSTVAHSKKLVEKKNIRIYSGSETITENPKEPIQIPGFYYHPTEKDEDGDFVEIGVTLVISPVVVTLSTAYTA